MKILQVSARYYPDIGGLEEHVRNISERLAKKHDVSVVTTDPSGRLLEEEVIGQVKVRRFKSWAPNEAYYFSGELRKYLVENSDGFDIVHAHGYHSLPALYASQAKDGNRMVFTPHYHGTGHTLFRRLLHVPYRRLGKRIFERADKVICVSLFEKSLVLKSFGLDEEKVEVIPNGVDEEEFKGLTKRKKNHLTILSVGRLEKYKGMQYLIRVLPKLEPDVVLEIVGKGPYKESLVKLAGKMSISNQVQFFHDLPRIELLQKYADANVFVLLSEHEAYSISVAEALCAKTPCVVANTSALTEWIDWRNCFGIDLPIDLDELGILIMSVVRKRIEGSRMLDWNEVANRLAVLYERARWFEGN